MRLIESAHRDKPRIGRALRPDDEPVRLGQNAELAFRGRQIAGYTASSTGGPPRLAVNDGLLGPQGAMPLHFTEYVRERWMRVADATWGTFLDLFHHRMLSLLYRARVAGEPVVARERPDDDSFARWLGSLGGIGHTARRNGGAVDGTSRLHFAALAGGKTRHASGLRTLLCASFGVPVTIEPFVGRWLAVPDDACTRLGAMHCAPLGQGRTLGRRIWDRSHAFRIVIGPLDAADSRRLQPGTLAFRRLGEWVRAYTGGMLEWEIELRLTQAAASPMRLGANTRLARDTWLGEGRAVSPNTAPSLRFRGDAGDAGSVGVAGVGQPH